MRPLRQVTLDLGPATVTPEELEAVLKEVEPNWEVPARPRERRRVGALSPFSSVAEVQSYQSLLRVVQRCCEGHNCP